MYNHSIPDGLKPHEFRRHPVTQMVLQPAIGGPVPDAADLDEIGLTEETLRALILDAANRIAEVFGSGEQQAARDEALQLAASIIPKLPEHMQAADYLRKAQKPSTAGLSPDELAALVPRN